MNWFLLNLVPLLNMLGIVFDAVGAFFVASEVVRQFRGRQFGATVMFDSSFAPPASETEEYKRWAHLKTRDMIKGLIFLAVGFLLQFVANALQLKACSNPLLHRNSARQL